MKLVKFEKYFLFLFFVALILITAVSAQSDLAAGSSTNLPVGLQKIIDYNNQSTADFAAKISFLIAFVAGMLGLLSPCLLPFLPAYFSYTFKEKRNITKMTLVFFFGFSLVFVAMGVIAGFIGAQVLTVIQSNWLATAAGVFIIILGVMSLLGKGFSSFIKLNRTFKNDLPGTFLFGIFFAGGWTACLGPILAGILGIGAILGNIWYSGFLLFFYSLGNFVPLFILSVFYDKLNLSQSKFMRGKMFKFLINKQEFQIHSTNLLSGILFIIMGIIIVVYQGTSVVNSWDVFGTKQYFYSIQRQLIEWEYANILGMILLILLVIFIGIFLWKYKSTHNKNNDDKDNDETKSVKNKYNRNSVFYDLLEYVPEKLLFSKWRHRYLSKLTGKILEIGVGTGKNFQYYPSDAQVTGIDLSPGMLNKAIEESNKLKRDYTLLQMDAQKLMFKDDSFDQVSCTFVLCSVPNPVKVLTEMRRVCKPDGKVVMIEHVLSQNRVIAFLQHLHNPFSKFLLGVNINRDTISNIKKAGLKIITETNLTSNDIFKFVLCEPNKTIKAYEERDDGERDNKEG